MKLIKNIAIRLAWGSGVRAGRAGKHPNDNPFIQTKNCTTLGDIRLAWDHGHGLIKWNQMVDGYVGPEFYGCRPFDGLRLEVIKWTIQRGSCMEFIRRKRLELRPAPRISL